MLEIVFGVVVIIGNNVRPYPVAARLSAWLELAVMVSYSPWRFPRLFCRFFLRNRCLWTLFSQVLAEAVVFAIIIFLWMHCQWLRIWWQNLQILAMSTRRLYLFVDLVVVGETYTALSVRIFLKSCCRHFASFCRRKRKYFRYLYC